MPGVPYTVLIMVQRFKRWRDRLRGQRGDDGNQDDLEDVGKTVSNEIMKPNGKFHKIMKIHFILQHGYFFE